MVANMFKGTIVGSRPRTVRETTTVKRNDYGPWMCVPMNVPNRLTETLKFFEWYYAVGNWEVFRHGEADDGGRRGAVELLQGDGHARADLHRRVPHRLRGVYDQAQQEVSALLERTLVP